MERKKHKSKGNIKARFELFINESRTVVIHMLPGTVFCYSGYMLTHCQQLTMGTYDGELDVPVLIPWVITLVMIISSLLENIMNSLTVNSLFQL